MVNLILLVKKLIANPKIDKNSNFGLISKNIDEESNLIPLYTSINWWISNTSEILKRLNLRQKILYSLISVLNIQEK